MRAKREKRVALICQHFYPEMMSTGLLLTELATGLVEDGFSIRVYASKPSYLEAGISAEIPPRMHHEGVEIIRIPAIGNPKGKLPSRTLFSITYLLGTLWHIIRDRREITGILSTTNPPFIGLVAFCARALFGIPYITIVHDIYPDVAIQLGVIRQNGIIAFIWEKMTRLVLNHGEQNTVLGRDMDIVVKRKLQSNKKNRTQLIPNWSDERRMDGGVPSSENPFVANYQLADKFVVQYSGRMGRTHNIEPLIEAAALMQDEAIVFQLIGDGPKRAALEQMVRARQLENVKFLPYQPIDELHFSLSAADIAVVCLDAGFTGLSVPSKSYGIMANGTAILALLDKQSEIGKVVEEFECGIVINEPTGAQIVEQLEQLMNDPAHLLQLGVNGYDAFKKHFTRAKAVESYAQLIHTVFADEQKVSQPLRIVDV